MTIEQQEQHILSLVHRLPILRRIRLALTILKGVEPNQIPLEDMEADQLEPEDQKLANKLLERKQSCLNDEGKNISRQDLMTKIYAELSKEG